MFRRNNHNEEALEEERTIKVGRKSEKKESKPRVWGKKERYFVFVFFVFTLCLSFFLALVARKGKLPGVPRARDILVPSTNETIIVERKTPEPNLENLKKQIINEWREKTVSLSGVYALYVVDLESSMEFGVNENEVMQAASLIKLPIMVSAFQESENSMFSLDTKYTLKESDKIGGSGSLYGAPAGTVITYRKLLEKMGKESDNTAFGIIKSKLGSAKIAEKFARMDLRETSVEQNLTTPREIGQIFLKLYAGSLLNSKNKNELFEYLTDTIYEAYLPKGIPVGIKVSHKYGREVHVLNDAGVVFYEPRPYVVVIMTDGVIEPEVEKVFTSLSAIVFTAFHSYYPY